MLDTVFPVAPGEQTPPRVNDVDALLEELRTAGVQVDPHREEYDYAPLAWIMGPGW